MSPRRALLLLTTLAPMLGATAATPAATVPPTPFDVSRPEITAFIAQAAERTGLASSEIQALLSQAQSQPAILDAMSRPAERVLPWWQYRARFLAAQRITAGVQFWELHHELLARIERERGVPAEYLVAILGIETSYGRVMGRYRVLDALATLGFDYPPRGEYFRKELEQFLSGDVGPAATGSEPVGSALTNAIRRLLLSVSGLPSLSIEKRTDKFTVQ